MTGKQNVYQRLAKVMESVTYIQKEKKQGMNYTIVSHDAVTAKVRPALLEAGIVYYPTRCETSQDGNRTTANMTVRFVNIDEPSDFFDVETFGYGVDSQDKGPGKAMSYAVKYALLKALGLETGDDADHDQGPSANYVDPAIMEITTFGQDIDLMGSLEDLDALLKRYMPAIDKVSKLDPARTNQVKQKYMARKKALAAA